MKRREHGRLSDCPLLPMSPSLIVWGPRIQSLCWNLKPPTVLFMRYPAAMCKELLREFQECFISQGGETTRALQYIFIARPLMRKWMEPLADLLCRLLSVPGIPLDSVYGARSKI